MLLRERQCMFARNAARLVAHVFEAGYAVTLGEAWRPPETAAAYARDGRGIGNSLHIERLAIDLNLFKDGVYLAASEAHRSFGEYWKSLHPDNRWGGEFPRPDGNHYEMRK